MKYWSAVSSSPSSMWMFWIFLSSCLISSLASKSFFSLAFNCSISSSATLLCQLCQRLQQITSPFDGNFQRILMLVSFACCTLLHCTGLHCTALHCTVLYCTALHCTALHFTVLYCTVNSTHWTISEDSAPPRAISLLSWSLLFDEETIDSRVPAPFCVNHKTEFNTESETSDGIECSYNT